jgi:hypothetical protein
MLLNEPPNKIYLQFYGDGEYDPEDKTPVDDGDVTWCTDPQWNGDILYVREHWLQRLELIEVAAKALIKCKGRYHTEQNMKALIEAVNAPVF